MTVYCQVYGVIHFTSPAGWLPVHRDQLRAQRSVTSMGKLYLYLSILSLGLEALCFQVVTLSAYVHVCVFTQVEAFWNWPAYALLVEYGSFTFTCPSYCWDWRHCVFRWSLCLHMCMCVCLPRWRHSQTGLQSSSSWSFYLYSSLAWYFNSALHPPGLLSRIPALLG